MNLLRLLGSFFSKAKYFAEFVFFDWTLIPRLELHYIRKNS